MLTKDEGGRKTPFFANYQPQFYFRTTDVTGAIKLLGGGRDGHARRQPGRHGRAGRKPVAMDEGLRFAIREGGRTVGSGVVTEILD